jgi:hypothetical protein
MFSIYIFGGGQANKKRFNDTLQIQLPQVYQNCGEFKERKNQPNEFPVSDEFVNECKDLIVKLSVFSE